MGIITSPLDVTLANPVKEGVKIKISEEKKKGMGKKAEHNIQLPWDGAALPKVLGLRQAQANFLSPLCRVPTYGIP